MLILFLAWPTVIEGFMQCMCASITFSDVPHGHGRTRLASARALAGLPGLLLLLEPGAMHLRGVIAVPALGLGAARGGRRRAKAQGGLNLCHVAINGLPEKRAEHI